MSDHQLETLLNKLGRLERAINHLRWTLGWCFAVATTTFMMALYLFPLTAVHS